MQQFAHIYKYIKLTIIYIFSLIFLRLKLKIYCCPESAKDVTV